MPERIEIIVTTDAADATGKLDELAAQVEALTGVKPEITVQAETEAATEGLGTVAEGADAVDGKTAAVDVEATGVPDAIADIGTVAEGADELDGTAAAVDVSATGADLAYADLGTVAEGAAALDGATAAVDVAATGAEDAADELDAVAEGADELDGTAAAVDVSAPGASDAIADIESVATAAEETAAATHGIGDAAVTSAGSVKGATKDMLRPLGLAKSSVSDLTDTFQLLADTAVEGMDLTEDQAGKLAGALPVIGVAIGLAVSAWQTYSNAQKEAAENADRARDEFREVADALATGDIEEAAARLVSANEDIFESGADMGVPYQQLADYITGAADTIPALQGRTGELGSATSDLAISAQGARAAFLEQAGAAGTLGDRSAAAEGAIRTFTEGMGGAAEAAATLSDYLADVNAQLDEQKAALSVVDAIDDLETAMWEAAFATKDFGAQSEQAEDANRNLQGALIDAKQDVIDYAEEVGDIPPEKITDILALLDQGKLDAAEAALNQLERDRVATIFVDAVRRGVSGWANPFGGSGRAATLAAGAEPAARAAAPAAMTVAPQVIVRVDARGAVDPYSVGRAVEQAAGAWGRVSGQWRPGLRSVS